jgi:hypothetical protein
MNVFESGSHGFGMALGWYFTKWVRHSVNRGSVKTGGVGIGTDGQLSCYEPEWFRV